MHCLGRASGAGGAIAFEQEQQFHARRPAHPSGDIQWTLAPGTYADPGAAAASRDTRGKGVEAAFVEGIPFRSLRFGSVTLDQHCGTPVFRVYAKTAGALLHGAIWARHGGYRRTYTSTRIARPAASSAAYAQVLDWSVVI
jgi:hypothetical protein